MDAEQYVAGEGGSVAVVLEVTEQHLLVDGMQVVVDLEVNTGHHTAVDDTLIVAGLEVAAVHHAVVEGTKVVDG